VIRGRLDLSDITNGEGLEERSINSSSRVRVRVRFFSIGDFTRGLLSLLLLSR